MKLTTVELKAFRDRALQAKTYGYEIALADQYVESLAAEVGQEIVPEGVKKGSAEHLFALAEEALKKRSPSAADKKRPDKTVPPPPKPPLKSGDDATPPPKPPLKQEEPAAEPKREELPLGVPASKESESDDDSKKSKKKR